MRCTHTSLSLLSIISITINRSAPLTCTPSHRITAHTHAIESMLMLILGCHTTDLQVFSCPRILPLYSFLPCSFLRLVVALAASGQDTQKGPPAPPVIVPCVSSSPCLLPTALAILPSRHPTDGLHLLLGSSFTPRLSSEPGLPPTGPSPLPLQSSKYSEPSALDPAVYSYLYPPPPLFRILSCSFPSLVFTNNSLRIQTPGLVSTRPKAGLHGQRRKAATPLEIESCL